MSVQRTRAGEGQVSTLDGWRFFATLTVLSSHYCSMVFKVTPQYLPVRFAIDLSGIGMTLFFVLSGFVIQYNYHEVGTRQAGQIGRFFRARFARIYPLFFVVTSADVIVAWLRPTASTPYVRHALLYYLPLVQAWRYDVLGQFSLIYQFAYLSSVTWSISVEVFFYAVYALVLSRLLFVTRFRTQILVAVLAYAATIALFYLAQMNRGPINNWAAQRFGPVAHEASGSQDSFMRWLVYFSPYARSMEFLVGCVTGACYIRFLRKPPEARRAFVFRRPGAFAALLTIAIMAITVLMYERHLAILGYASSVILAPLIAVLLYTTACYPSWVSRMLDRPAMRAGGEATYAIYLLHIPLFLSYATPAFPRDQIPVALLTVKLVLQTTLVLSLARLVFVAFEDPARRILRGRLPAPEWPRAAWQALRRRPGLAACTVVSHVLLSVVDRALVARMHLS